MPWTTASVERHKKGLTEHQKRVWVKTANAVLKQSGDEAKAIKIANQAATRAKPRKSANNRKVGRHGRSNH